MSSAILYLAIVALWAVMLVPRWLHRAHAPRRADVEIAAPEVPADPAQSAGASVPGGNGSAGQEAGQGRHSGRDERVPPGWGPGEEDTWAFPTADRARVLRARRRMLVTLVMITAAALAIVLLHLAATWVVVPPVVMLAGFLLLLREAARTDARQARDASANAAQARVAHARPQRPARDGTTQAGTAPAAAGHGAGEVPQEPQVTVPAGPPEPVAAPDADIIDLSARLGDQLYDQYSDAAERAVGD